MAYPHKRLKITETLERWFEEGRFRPGDRFPSDHELAREFKVNHLTVRAALRPFIDAGRLERRIGAGTIVRTGEVLPAAPPVFEALLNERSVGVAIPEAGHGFYTALLRAVEDTLLGAGRPLVLGQTWELAERERQILSAWVAQGVRSLLIAATGPDLAFYESLLARGTRLVLVDRRVPGLAAPSVTTRDDEGVVAAIDHLIALGHERIVHLAGPSTIWTAQKRRQAFVDRLAILGRPADEGAVVQGSFFMEGGYRAMKGLLAAGPPPDAILAANDPAAVGAIRALEEHGLRVPDDVSVVGFGDDEDLSRNFGLTTVRQFPARLAEEAMRLVLAETVTGDEAIEIAPELVVRTSTAPRTRRNGPQGRGPRSRSARGSS
jgi:LacI family transcriptional regulator